MKIRINSTFYEALDQQLYKKIFFRRQFHSLVLLHRVITFSSCSADLSDLQTDSKLTQGFVSKIKLGISIMPPPLPFKILLPAPIAQHLIIFYPPRI